MIRKRTLAAGLGAAVGLAYWTTFRSTSQLFGHFPFRAPNQQDRVIALTFDDGPNEPYTSRLLDVLDGRGVRATFFQVGRCAERFPSSTRRIVDSGHVLGNHSFSHAFSHYLSEPRQREEIARTQTVLQQIAGVTPALYRPPWLCHPPWVLASVQEHRLQVVSGTFGHPLEVFQPRGERMAAFANRLAEPGSILIFHDGREARGGSRAQTVAAIGPLIDTLADRGYRFVTVDRLLSVPAYL